MDALGINWIYLTLQILACGIYPVLAISALLFLRRAEEPKTSKTLWALLIIVVPILGDLAFFISNYGDGE